MKTSPLAGDDFQLICIVLGFYRAVQIVCLVPLIINDVIRLYNGSDLNVEGTEAQNFIVESTLATPNNISAKRVLKSRWRDVRSVVSAV